MGQGIMPNTVGGSWGISFLKFTGNPVLLIYSLKRAWNNHCLCMLQLFERLAMLRPHFSRQIVAVAGDIADNDLGISDADRQRLESNVSVAIHLAASLSFTDTLRYVVVPVLGHTQVRSQTCRSSFTLLPLSASVTLSGTSLYLYCVTHR